MPQLLGDRLTEFNLQVNPLAIIVSPDRKCSVERHDDYGEIGMGSPWFGHITVKGATIQFPNSLFGEAVAFSPDSRFLALEELVETRPFRTKLIVIELARPKIFIVRVQSQGMATPKEWKT